MDDVVCGINEPKRVGTRYKVDIRYKMCVGAISKKDNIVECVKDISGVTLIVNGE